MFTGTQSVDAYYQDVSDGRLGVTGDVFGWFTVSRTSTSTCDYSAWGNAARTAATNAGVDLSSYQSVMYYWPQQTACSWAGLGQLPGSTIWINGYNTMRVLGHELGHNLGEHHAQSQQCSANGSPVSFPGSGVTCNVVEYGDPFTIMGGSSYYLQSNAARAHYGYVAPVTTTAGTGGTYTLVPADSTTGTRLVRVPRGDGSYLSLEFRQPAGVFDTFPASSAVANGITLRIDWGTGTKQTTLIDTVPGTASYADAPLLVGKSVTDPVSGATFTTTAASASGATVTVSYGGGSTPPPPAADTTAPTSVTGLTATSTSTPSVSLSWGAATDDVGVTGYRVSRDGSVLGTVTSGSFTDSAVSNGATYTYSVSAVDAAGNVGPASSVSTTVPSAPTTDTTAPTSVTNLKAVANKKGVVSVTWSAATDNKAVTGYTISRSGLTKTQTTTSLSDKPGRGTWTYTVVAKDAAGNTSAPVSVSVTV
jgi:chitodextrinase